jgi:DNA polymerase-3 subunit delta
VPTQSIGEFEKALGKGKVPSLVLFAGEEARLVDRGLARLRDAVVPPAQRDFNEDRLRADEVDVPRLLDSLRTLPLFGGRRLVILRDAHRLEDRGGAREALRDALAAYADDPAEGAVLALTAEKVDRRLKVWKAIEKAGVVVDCGTPDAARLPARLEETAEAAGVGFEPGAAALLVELAGADLGVLEGEVEKLAAYVGPAGRISPQAVTEMLESRQIGDARVFEWVDAVAMRQPDRALTGLNRLLASGEEPLRLLALLARQVRLVWSARSLMARGAGFQEVADRVVPRTRFLAGKLLDQARGFTEAELAVAHEAIADADLALKSSPASSRFVMERLVLAVTGPRGAAPARRPG